MTVCVQEVEVVERASDEVINVHGHFVNLCAVVLLNVSQDPNVVILYKVDGHSSPTISP